VGIGSLGRILSCSSMFMACSHDRSCRPDLRIQRRHRGPSLIRINGQAPHTGTGQGGSDRRHRQATGSRGQASPQGSPTTVRREPQDIEQGTSSAQGRPETDLAAALDSVLLGAKPARKHH
jgi:hypothetical protein